MNRRSFPLALALMLLSSCGSPPSAVATPHATPGATAPSGEGETLGKPGGGTEGSTTGIGTSYPKTQPGTTIRFEGGDGSSIASAIRIEGAIGESDGVACEYWLLDAVFGPRATGAWSPGSQALITRDGRQYDRLDFGVGGRTMGVYFDITGYFGKFAARGTRLGSLTRGPAGSP